MPTPGTLFYTPEYQLGAGRVFTAETNFSQNLPAHGKWVPSLSATYGYQWGSRNPQFLSINGNGETEYAYWNAGAQLRSPKYYRSAVSIFQSILSASPDYPKVPDYIHQIQDKFLSGPGRASVSMQ